MGLFVVSASTVNTGSISCIDWCYVLIFWSRIALILQVKSERGDKFGMEAGVLIVQKKSVNMGKGELWKTCIKMMKFDDHPIHVELRGTPVIGTPAGLAGSPPGGSSGSGGSPARVRSRERPSLRR